MTDTRADEIIRRQEQLAGSRTTFESHWAEIAERVQPSGDTFTRSRVPGEKHTEKVFDATATLAGDRLAAAMESMITPRTQKYHGLRCADEAANEVPAVKAYLEQVVKIMFAARYSPRANFAAQSHETYRSVGFYGTGALFIDDDVGRGMRYRAISLSETFLAANHQGVVDTVYRKFKLSARQAKQKFGDEVPEAISKAMEKSPDQEFDFIHAVAPREDMDISRKGYKGWPIASCYVSCEGRKLVSEGGFSAMPYAIGRDTTNAAEVYGRSRTMTVLPDIKMLNEMSKTVIRAAHKIVDPPLLLQEDGALSAFDARPAALNFGGVDERGQPVVHAMQTNARVDIGLDMMEQRRRTINDAFLVTLFQILVDNPQMTATEAMLRAQEKGALLAPTMGRLQSEFLGAIITRELDILARAGALPPMPDELIRAGGMVDVEYLSPLNRAQRAEDGVAIMRTLEAIAPLAQVDPSVMSVFDAPEIARELAEINGVPAKLVRSPEDVATIQKQQKQTADAAALLQAAPVASGVVKDLAQAQAMAASAPRQAAPAVVG